MKMLTSPKFVSMVFKTTMFHDQRICLTEVKYGRSILTPALPPRYIQ